MFYTFDLPQGFHFICWACTSGRFYLWMVRAGWDEFIQLCSDCITDLVKVDAGSIGPSGREGRTGGCRKVWVCVQQEGHNPRDAQPCCSPEGYFYRLHTHNTPRAGTRVWLRCHSRIMVVAEDIHVLVFLQKESGWVIYFPRCLTKTACSCCFGLVNSVSSPLHCSGILL